MAIAPALAAPTDISDTPIVSTTAAVVKPNVMLLMDASDSMSWTHMPDEVEQPDGVHDNGYTLVGYKSAQCNVLYYNPQTSYLIPKKPDGTLFVTNPVFTAARYAGFGDFYATPDTTTTDLSSQFQAYDLTSLQLSGNQDTKQPAYYFVHTGGTATTLTYKSAPCTDPDVSSTTLTASTGYSASDGGTWTKVIVGATTGVGPNVDERQNFAIWYSYYRTRIGLIKSAASLAFTPLTDTFRVGFITVQPKDHPTDAAINPNKYLPVSDFNTTQRNAWFGKLFSQIPSGASPAREGLARVGRYYAGQEDSINTGMSATGANDPLLYACQQNFTIMTTDGYWNAQTETPDNGTTHGGALQIDGIHKIGQADGDTNDATTCSLNSTYCPRPIYDGQGGAIQVSQDASNSYDQAACTLATQVQTVYQPYTIDQHATATYSTTPRDTKTYTYTVAQKMSQTSSVTKAVYHHARDGLAVHDVATHIVYKDVYQIQQSQYQSTKTTTQVTSNSTQVQSRSHQVQETLSYQLQSSVQYQLVTSQVTKTTVQAYAETRHYTLGTQQTLKHIYRVTSKSNTEETYSPAASCVPSDTVNCRTVEIYGPSPVTDPTDPTKCVAGQQATSPYITTDCTPGPLTVAPYATASCTPGSSNSGFPDYAVTTCTDVQDTPPAPALTCTQGTVGTERTLCTYPVGPNNATVVGASSCGQVTNPASPYVYVSCTFTSPNNTTTYPNSCTVGTTTTTDGTNITSVCSKPGPTNYSNTQVAQCNPTTLANNQQITCSAVVTTFGPQIVSAPSCPSTAAVGNTYRTCTTVNLGAYPAYSDASGCSSDTGTTGTFTVVDCYYPPATNFTNVPVPQNQTCVQQSPLPGNHYVNVTCQNPVGPNNTTVFVPPSTCMNDPGTSGADILVVCGGPNR